MKPLIAVLFAGCAFGRTVIIESAVIAQVVIARLLAARAHAYRTIKAIPVGRKAYGNESTDCGSRRLGVRFSLAALFFATLSLFGQTVSISAQPGQVFVAAFGSSLTAVSVYSAEVCSAPGASVSGSWGQVRQIAEIGGLNIVDAVLVAPTAQLAEGKTKTHRAVIAIGYIGLAAAFAGVFHQAPLWLIEAGTTISGGAQILSPMFTANETRVQQTIQSALGSLADPSAQFSVANGACVSSRLMLGQSVKNFKPIVATLPSASVPLSAPNSALPTKAALETPDGYTTLLADEALSERDTAVLLGVQIALTVR